MNDRKIIVVFADKELENKFENLKDGTGEEKQLYKFIRRAIEDLKQDPTCGIKIPKDRWPKIYIKKYGITNLWKYDLPNAWRLIYTIMADKIMISSVILEWFSHKDYEKRFGY